MSKADSSIRSTNLSTVRHTMITTRLVIETGLLFLFFAILANLLGPQTSHTAYLFVLYLVVLFAQGLVLQRIYILAHEAAHKKVAGRLWLNDTIGQTFLLTILVPLQIYRKIHYFHHGFNRKDHVTSALDVFVSPWPVTPFIKIICFLLWYLGVFAGGFFFHSLVSIVFFLCMPLKLAQKISPAFKNWSNRDRLIAWGQFLCSLMFHVGVMRVLGFKVWLYSFGLPFISFAWIWSLLVYVFHYNTTIGDYVRYNVRTLQTGRLLSWLFMNFNQHATHHMYPNIAWYELKDKVEELPNAFSEWNQKNKFFWRAVMSQLHGPTVIYQKDENPTPQLFIHWED